MAQTVEISTVGAALEAPEASPEAENASESSEGARYELLEAVGEGASGVVYRARDSVTGGVVAVKVINMEETTEDLETVETEIQTLIGVHHRFLVRYLDSYARGSELHIVMEYMDGGSLAGLLKSLPGPGLDEATVAWVLRDLCEALAYLHGQRLLHRDIKASNVLVNRAGDVKLADFGASAQLTETVTKRQTLTGTPFWMAPEVILQSDYDAKADIWSLGVTAIELAKKEPPLAMVHPMKVLFLIPKSPPPTLDASFPKMLRNFVSACCQKEPADRPTAHDLLRSNLLLKTARRSAHLGRLVCEALAVPKAPPAASPLPRFYAPGRGHVGRSPSNDGSEWVFSPGASPAGSPDVSPGGSPPMRGRKILVYTGASRSPTQSPPFSGASEGVGLSMLDETTIRTSTGRRFAAMRPEAPSPRGADCTGSQAPLWERRDVSWLTDVYMPAVKAVEATQPDDVDLEVQVGDAAKMLELAGILLDGAAADGRMLRVFLRRLCAQLEELAGVKEA